MRGLKHGILEACDLFCGAGGTTTGAEMSGRVKVVLAVKTGHSIVVPWLTMYYGTGGVQSTGEPCDTITGAPGTPGRDRFGLAMASLLETMQTLHVIDIGFRMLDVDELARAQGFPDGYELMGTKADKVRQIGNSVSPVVAKALCEVIADAA